MDDDERSRRIHAALARRRFSPILKPRIEALLDGREDRARLRCCNSGCFVCVRELLAILTEVETGVPVAATPVCGDDLP